MLECWWNQSYAELVQIATAAVNSWVQWLCHGQKRSVLDTCDAHFPILWFFRVFLSRLPQCSLSLRACWALGVYSSGMLWLAMGFSVICAGSLGSVCDEGWSAALTSWWLWAGAWWLVLTVSLLGSGITWVQARIDCFRLVEVERSTKNMVVPFSGQEYGTVQKGENELSTHCVLPSECGGNMSSSLKLLLLWLPSPMHCYI